MDDYARNVSLTVGTSAVQISPMRNRSEIVVTNTGTTNITLSFGQPATVAGAGVFLVPYAVYFASTAQGFTVSNQELYAVSSLAGGSVAVFER